jgi:uncharacterized OsmC-like protein
LIFNLLSFGSIKVQAGVSFGVWIKRIKVTISEEMTREARRVAKKQIRIHININCHVVEELFYKPSHWLH